MNYLRRLALSSVQPRFNPQSSLWFTSRGLERSAIFTLTELNRVGRGPKALSLPFKYANDVFETDRGEYSHCE